MLNLAFALGSAVLLILCFPPFDFPWLAPFALAPLLFVCLRERSARKRALFGWAAGLLFWCGMCPWIQYVLEVHAGMNGPLSWFSYFLFGLYKGLPMALFAACAGFLLRRIWAIPAIAALWAGLERIHSEMGFAWLQLGNAGNAMAMPMRLAPVTGVYGLSFVFALLACAIVLMFQRRKRTELGWLGLLLILLLLPGLPIPAPATNRALLVQPNFDTEATWTTEFLERSELKLAELSRAAGVDLIVWPEVPAPFYPEERDFRDYASRIAQTAGADFLMGGVAFNNRRDPLNSAFWFDPGGKQLARYDKINLVPFGEYIPPFFNFVNRITNEAGDFARGQNVVVFPLKEERAGAFICYESATPDLVRLFPLKGASLLINISNDGYFGRSAAHMQHLQVVRMRAAENRRWILRASNDGITAVIDSRGRVTNRLVPYEQTAAIVGYGYEHETTFYTRHGDWFAWSALAIGLALSAYEWRITKTSPS